MTPTEPEDREKQAPKIPAWRAPLLYLLLVLFLLWIWQASFASVALKTISYSQFKDYLARREVVEAKVGPDEITGKIVPRPDTGAAAGNGTRDGAQAADAGGAAETATGKSEDAAGRSSSTGTGTSRDGAAGGSTGAPTDTSTTTEASAAPPTEPFHFRTVRIEDEKLVDELQQAGVRFEGVKPSAVSQFFWAWLLPLGFILVLWMMLFRRSPGPSLLNVGRSKAKLVAQRETGVTFQDVAGCDEAKAELQEVVDFLRNPERYQVLGAKIPKGVLLVGPPGTGKTLLARAVAGEAAVPFFSLSGSDFVEMFVGVGAARVRDLFAQAKAKAPCIIFIDELDAIGRQRGVHVGTVNDEREQTLNALLVEMDGFDPNKGIIILSATNRPDVLDRAILRPGRFDRQVVVDAPDLDGREAILRVHARGKPLAPDVELRRIAQVTPGFSGADLANTMNEAALLAARYRHPRITQRDLEEAVEKVVAGPERKSRRLDDDAKRRVAYHETGHALVAHHSEHADPVHKISIVPRGKMALGWTLQLPEGEQYLVTRAELLDRIKGLLGGRAAEEVVFGEVSTGAANDLERATDMVRQMVTMHGMGESIGLLHCGRPRAGTYLDHGSLQMDCSEATARDIDREVKRVLDEAYVQARDILVQNRDQLERVAAELLQRETIDHKQFLKLVERGPQARTANAASS